MNSWIKAIRPRTLPLAWACLTLGGVLAHMEGNFKGSIYGLSVFTAFCLQILSNLANDYGDAESGLDGPNREGPSRTIQEGLITKQQMKVAIGLMIVLSFISGLLLIYVSFEDWEWMISFLGLGLLSIWAAIKYTMGKNPYGYSGWGDLFVLIFFGWVGVGGSLFLYNQNFHWINLLPATSLGLFSVAVLNVNNIRDIESDKKSGKYSIPVRIGREAAIRYHGLILIVAISCSIAFALLREFQDFQWIFMLVLPFLIRNWNGIQKNKSPHKIDPFLRQMAFITLFFVVLFFFASVKFT